MVITDDNGHIWAERKADPFEVGVLTLCLLYGFLGMVWYDRLAGRVVRLYPYIGGRVFLVLLAVGSATALVGLAGNTLRSLRLERAGLWLLAALGASYALWTPVAVGWSGLGLIFFFGVMLFVPGAVVAARRGRLIAEIEKALPIPDEPEDQNGRT